LRLARAISARDSCAFAASTWTSLVGEMHTQQATCGERDLLLKLLIGRAGSGPRPFPGGGRHSLGGANSAAGPGNSQRQGDRRDKDKRYLNGSALVLVSKWFNSKASKIWSDKIRHWGSDGQGPPKTAHVTRHGPGTTKRLNPRGPRAVWAENFCCFACFAPSRQEWDNPGF
jgi:hypothetical protein